MDVPATFLTSAATAAVEHVTLNRPDVRNAFNDEVIAELTAWARTRRGRRAGARRGARRAQATHFCAGADIAWMAQHGGLRTKRERRATRARIAAMFGALDTLPVPLVGRVHGAALGGGTGLAAVCDIVVAAESTRSSGSPR